MTTLQLQNGITLHCEALVRFVQSRRAVYKATMQIVGLPKQKVFAKVFSGKNLEKYASRDKAGCTLLSAANILAPAIVADSYLEGGSARVLCYEAIDTASAEDTYNRLRIGEDHAAEYQARLALMKLLTVTVAEHHLANLIQTDLYLKNFLVKDNLVYTLDGDGIRALSPIFKKHQKKRNLATLFSKMDVLDDDWILVLYEMYCEKMGLRYSLFDEAEIWMLTQKIRLSVSTGYAEKKVFRSCSDVKVTHSFTSYTALAREIKGDISQVLVNSARLDELLEDTGQRIKTGNTCTVGLADIGSTQLVIKRYNIKNSLHALSRAFRPSRAARSWANAYRLNISNIATPKPLALVEERYGLIRRRAYFLAEYVNAPDIAEFFEQTHHLEDKKTVADEVAQLFYKLYLLKFSHGDCKATNIKIVDLKPVLIDLDSMLSHTSAWRFEAKHVRDLKRFMRNWEHDPETTALLKQAFVLQHDDEDGVLALAGIV